MRRGKVPFPIALFTSLLVGCALIPISAIAAKPNILVIWGDDIGEFNISAYNMEMMG